MKTYICTKIIHAVPAKMVNGVAWPEGLPLPELPERPSHEECCCVNEAANVVENGYMYTTSQTDRYPQFMSKDEFEKMCRDTENMTFGDALDILKRGGRVARKGWNGKNQHVELASCISYKSATGETVNVDHYNIGNKALAFVGTSGVQMGWLASQADMLADDWFIVE